MKWNKKTIPAVSLVLLFSATMAFGQQSTTTKAVPASDAQFAKEAAQANLAEIKLGQLAEKNGSGATVKNFGQRMMTDHSAAQQKLEAAAAQDNIKLPTAPNAQQQATYDQLSQLHGVKFDQAYAKDMVQDHTKDISTFKHEANDGHNTTIKNFASATLPTLQEHLRLAHQMNQKVSAMTTQTSNPHS